MAPAAPNPVVNGANAAPPATFPPADVPRENGRRRTLAATTGIWQIGKTVGAGSMGKVKLAKNQDTDEMVR